MEGKKVRGEIVFYGRIACGERVAYIFEHACALRNGIRYFFLSSSVGV